MPGPRRNLARHESEGRSDRAGIQTDGGGLKRGTANREGPAFERLSFAGSSHLMDKHRQTVSRFAPAGILVSSRHAENFTRRHRQTLRPAAPYEGNWRLRRRDERIADGKSGAVTRIAAAVDASLATVSWPLPPKRICSSCITDCSGGRRSRGRAKNMNCSGCWWKTIWRFTVRTCRSTRIPGSATTRGFAPRSA